MKYYSAQRGKFFTKVMREEMIKYHYACSQLAYYLSLSLSSQFFISLKRALGSLIHLATINTLKERNTMKN
jgi:hypothetical protein